MNQMRGIVMLLAACIAFYRGWRIHTGPYAHMAFGLGAVALALAVWHLMRKPAKPRVE